MLISNGSSSLKSTQSAVYDLEKEQRRISSGEVSIKEASGMIQMLLDHSSDNVQEPNSAADYTCANAEILTDALAMCPSGSLEDVIYKIKAWLAVSPATSRDTNHATCDELLAYSIMSDVIALAKKTKS